MNDIQFKQNTYLLSEIEHSYGKNVHILSNPILFELLAKISSPTSEMPLINRYLEQIYIRLLQEVIAVQDIRLLRNFKTRMNVDVSAMMLNLDQHFITVDLARAGTYPSQLIFNELNTIFTPSGIRQDHIYLNRKTNDQGKVIGVDYAGSKIGGGQDEAIVLFPDPMGATGGSLCHVIDLYKNSVSGTAKKYIALHLIITPEYIRRLQDEHPDVEIFAVRLDRGLSNKKCLDAIPGTFWEQERGLNENQYIIPGAGGVGELLNNTDS